MKLAFLPAAFIMILFFLPTVSSQCVMNDFTFYPTPNTSRPAKGVTFQDPVFHTNITRITDGPTDLGVNYVYSGYPKKNIENSDGTRLFLQSGKYPYWQIWNSNPPYNKIKDIPNNIAGGDTDPDVRWDATDPNVLYTTFSTKLYKYNIVTDEITLLHDFKNDDFNDSHIVRVYTAEEGDASADRRYWAFKVRCYDANHSPTWWDTAIIVYDKDFYGKDNGKIISQLNDTSPLFAGLNYAGISFDGNWVFCTEPGVIYNRNLSSVKTTTIGGHADRAIDVDGRQVIIGGGQYYKGGYTDMGIWAKMVDMATGEETWLAPLGYYAGGGYHVSANSMEKPGWGVFSTWGPTYPSTQTDWSDASIIMVELNKTAAGSSPDMSHHARIWRVAHTHTVRKLAGEDPFGTINKKGTKIFFSSAWGQSYSDPGGQNDVYQIDIPQECFSYFPPAPNCTVQGGDCSMAGCCSGLYCSASNLCQNCLSSETGKCTGNLDEDCDGLKDCNDPDCSSDPACIACSNLGSSCASSSCCSGLYCDASKLCQNCLSSEAGKCTNGIDDNCNGLTDCSDPSCFSDPSCCKTLGQSCVTGTCCSGLTCQSVSGAMPKAIATADKLSGPAPLWVQFYGSGTDSDGNITSYGWSYGDTGGTPNDPAYQNWSHTYSTAGNYKLVLTVIDNSGFKGSTYLDIHVTGGTNNIPTAIASANPVSGAAPLTVTFTGSATDSDGTIAMYNWDFGEPWQSVAQNTAHIFNNPGNYMVTLMAMDNSSAFGNAIMNITVTGSNSVCTAGGCLKAETSPCNGCVEMNELTAFIDRWKVSNLDVTLRDLIEAIGLWKKGC